MNRGAALLPMVLVTILGAATWAVAGGSAPDSGTRSRSHMKIRLTLPDNTLTATLSDRETSRDFVSLLPLTLTMRDLFGREKYGRIPRALADSGDRRHTYEAGQLIYWSPGPDIAVYYRDDGERIPAPGIIVLGTVDSNVEALNVPGSVKVTIDLIGRAHEGSSDAGRQLQGEIK